jgi:uncharacterized protein YijF (DUF1287 family)
MRAFLACILLCGLSVSPDLVEGQTKVYELLESARSQVGKTIIYDGSYQVISYPGGDIPLVRGVCTDVIVRAYRALGFDLQKLVHQDMLKHFKKYPSKRIWGLTRPDRNIDHRRVPNLSAFFERHAQIFSTDLEKHPSLPGDLLTWSLPGGLPHIGLVSDRKTPKGVRYLVIHNIGSGAQEEDVIGQFELTGHYRYHPWGG